MTNVTFHKQQSERAAGDLEGIDDIFGEDDEAWAAAIRTGAHIKSKVIKAKVGGGRKGNIAGLAKHLAKTYGGDPHFFTKCMAADELAEYPEENRSGICAKAHYIATGKWPGEHPRKGKKIAKTSKELSLDDRVNTIRSGLHNQLNPPMTSQAVPTQKYIYVDKIYPGYAIANADGKYIKITYSLDSDGNPTIINQEEVEPNWQPVTKQTMKEFLSTPSNRAEETRRTTKDAHPVIRFKKKTQS